MFRNYREILDYLFSSLPMYQRTGPAAYKADLGNILTLDHYFDHPHRNYPSIHIAGTNGKGSVAHMLASVCQVSGLKTGLYTSPHLKDFTERIRVNGNPIPQQKVLQFFRNHIALFDKLKPSFFEMTVALAFWWFRETNVDIAIVETGLGGRLDSTNIIEPVISVITNIGMDHMQLLGNDLAEIAREKAGIIKKGIPVVVGETTSETESVFRTMAGEMEAPIYLGHEEYQIPYSMMDLDGYQVLNVYRKGKLYLENLKVDLGGIYQRKNLVTVLTVIDRMKEQKFPVTMQALEQGLKQVVRNTGLRGRWEILRPKPLVLADTAHNVPALQLVMKQIESIPKRNLFFVLGFVEDKDIRSIVHLFPANARYFFTRASIPRALDPEQVLRLFSSSGREGMVIPNPADALNEALKFSGPEDVIYVGGSTFVVAEIL